MLEQSFREMYNKVNLSFYRKVFARMRERRGSLSATEAFSLEIIQALDRPTVSQYARFIGVSRPNATYKVNSLIKKGYLRKLRSQADKRAYYLELTDKSHAYAQMIDDSMQAVFRRIQESFTPEETHALDRMLAIIANELVLDN